jgi:hypothetical protein
MKPFYFLAEMSVSEKHGSGITVCRTLGRDLESVKTFFCLDDDYDQEQRFLPRTHRWRPIFTNALSRRLIGCRLSHALNTSHWHRKLMGRVYAQRIASLLPNTTSPLKILVCPQNTLSMYTMKCLRNLRPVSYVTWIMDNNWVHRSEDGAWSYSKTDNQVLSDHFKQAGCVFTISEPMGQHFQEHFGIPCQELFAPASLNISPPSSAVTPSKKLGYFGNLHAWPVDALSRLAPLLRDSGYTLDIYSYSKLPESLRLPEVTLKPPLPAQDVIHAMREYAAVVLPMGFSAATAAYSTFNIATKMAECLGSGTVTFAIGPDDAAMIRYLRLHQVGVTLSDLRAPTFTGILKLLDSPEHRTKIIRDQSEHVASYLNMQITSARFAHSAGLADHAIPQTESMSA